MDLQEHVDAMLRMRRDEMQREGEGLFQALIVDAPVQVLPEHIFRDYFLRKFMGLETNDRWITEWISIAGTPMAEVDIIDESGQALYRVPALLDTNSLFVNDSSRSLGNIFKRYDMIRQNSTVDAERFLRSALYDVNETLHTQYNLKPSLERWVEILQRYNLKLHEDTPSSTVEAESLDDFISY